MPCAQIQSQMPRILENNAEMHCKMWLDFNQAIKAVYVHTYF